MARVDCVTLSRNLLQRIKCETSLVFLSINAAHLPVADRVAAGVVAEGAAG